MRDYFTVVYWSYDLNRETDSHRLPTIDLAVQTAFALTRQKKAPLFIKDALGKIVVDEAELKKRLAALAARSTQ